MQRVFFSLPDLFKLSHNNIIIHSVKRVKFTLNEPGCLFDGAGNTIAIICSDISTPGTQTILPDTTDNSIIKQFQNLTVNFKFMHFSQAEKSGA
jgi:hypothetical protein